MRNEDVKLIRLVRGDEILAELVENKDGKVKFRNALRVMLIPQKSTPNQPTVGLAPWMEFSNDDEFEIDSSHVLVITTPIKDFVQQYRSAFSPILTPGPSELLNFGDNLNLNSPQA